jgi:hypothetical protein
VSGSGIDNHRRAAHGRAAVAAGTPDYGQNGDDLDGVLTDAGDAVANVLHLVAQEVARLLPDADVDAVEVLTLTVCDKARLHFAAELRGEA